MTHQPRTLTPDEEMRLLAGFVVQPFLAAGVAFMIFPWLLLDRAGRTLAGGSPTDPTAAAVSVALATGIAACLVTLFGVFPTALWILKRRPLSLPQALLFGVGFGNVPILLGNVLTGGGYGFWGTLRGAAFASLIGLAGAAAFWGISIRGRDFSRDPAAG